MKIVAILSFLCLLFWAGIDRQNNKKIAEREIVMAEANFAAASASRGVRAAFLEFADDSAVIVRAGRVYNGKRGIDEYYSNQSLKNVSLTWKPDFVQAAHSADLGYTYGKYHFSAIDSSGKTITAAGIFHTVWRKQRDGKWKFMYD